MRRIAWVHKLLSHAFSKKSEGACYSDFRGAWSAMRGA